METVKLRATGKWILAGEHSVLRGFDALVFPLESKALIMNGDVTLGGVGPGDLKFDAEGELFQELPSLFMAVLNRAYELVPEKQVYLKGKLHLTNELPFGAGLGASASACVLVAKLFLQMKLIEPSQLFFFSRQLENIFHGESSGVDVAVTIENKPILFNREKGYRPLNFLFKPNMSLHYTGKRGVTRECIEVVKDFITKNPEQARQLDLKMQSAVSQSSLAFEKQDLALLANAMDECLSIYKTWGLVDGMTESLIARLKGQGALAVKPTGSGLGGFVLALWGASDLSWKSLQGIPAFSSQEL